MSCPLLVSLPTVFLVDDDAQVRASLVMQFMGAGWQAEAFESLGAFFARGRTAGASCLLLNADLPGLRVLDAQRLLLLRKEVTILFYTGGGELVDGGRLMDSVRQALERSRATLVAQEELVGLRAALASLTAREREVMALVVTGLLNKQIAARLGISEITVKIHRAKVMRKMNAGSLAELVRMADRLQLPAGRREPDRRPAAHDHAHGCAAWA